MAFLTTTASALSLFSQLFMLLSRMANLSFSDNIISSIWGVMGYTVLLAFTLFKTGSLAKSVFAAH